eukprot:4659118-Prymnesium_polylepis.3
MIPPFRQTNRPFQGTASLITIAAPCHYVPLNSSNGHTRDVNWPPSRRYHLRSPAPPQALARTHTHIYSTVHLVRLLVVGGAVPAEVPAWIQNRMGAGLVRARSTEIVWVTIFVRI